MKESSGMRRPLLKKLRLVSPLAHVVAVENDVLPGYPDVEGCVAGFNFTIECKLIDDWPARSRTPVRLTHFTKEQKLFLRTRWRAGGASFLLLKIASTREWLLFCGLQVKPIGETATKADLYVTSEKIWRGGIDAKELIEVMKGARNVL